jgi:hypothetical protein
MDIANTLMLLMRDPNLCAWRERGIAIAVTPGHVIQRVFVPRPYRWNPSITDLIALDWQTGTPQQFYEKYRPEGQAG